MFYFQRPLAALNNYGGLKPSWATYVTVTLNADSSPTLTSSPPTGPAATSSQPS